MRLATIPGDISATRGNSRDGQLVIVGRDGNTAALIPHSKYLSLQQALDDWQNAFPFLLTISQQLDARTWPDIITVSHQTFLPPLPRAYAFLDGSAFLEHVRLARAARGAEPPEDLLTVPLMYQGLSDSFLAPAGAIPLLDESLGLDFEGELGIVVDDVPMGISPLNALSHIKLVVLLNDVTLRNLVPREMKTGFGFLQSKPASALGPFAVTPDELGGAWHGGRARLTLNCSLNGNLVGSLDTGEMHFSFGDLIAHACRTRSLGAGTIIGSGTVSNKQPALGSNKQPALGSNKEPASGVACLAELRMREQIEQGAPNTPFLRAGDVVELEALHQGRSLFGKIINTVIAAER